MIVEVIPELNYIHKKTGHLYYVGYIAIDATNSRDGQEVVIYRRLDGEIFNVQWFCRELNEFKEKFKECTENDFD